MIRMNDFQRDPEELIKAQLIASERVFRSGHFILGKEVQSFEREWAKISGAKHAVGVGNGMDAIEIGLRALGIGHGDEVITTGMTAFASVLAILRAGATPVLADIKAENALLDLRSVERCFSKKTKAILLVHLYGQINAMEDWQKLAKEKNVYLIEDCAQSHLAEWKGIKAGNFGEFGAYSFYPTKNLGAIGDAGAIVTNNHELADKFQMLRNYGQKKRYEHEMVGLNSRLDELHAAILLERLRWLEKFTSQRIEIASKFFSDIKNSKIELLEKPTQKNSHVYHLFVIKTPLRAKLMEHLKSRGIESLCHYPIPMHQQKPCLEIRKDPNGLKQTECFAESCLSIPCHPHLNKEETEKIIEGINDFRG